MLGIRSWKRGWATMPTSRISEPCSGRPFGTPWDPSLKSRGSARLVGLFLANGFQYDDDDNRVLASEGDDDLRYLDVVVLGK